MKKYTRNGPPLRTIALKIKGSKDTTVGCNCTKTRCMNFFCSCFSSLSSCAKGCNCYGCNNTPGYRKMASNVKFDTFCNCSRSNCIKKYCECFKKGQGCSKACGCTNCYNADHKIPALLENKDASKPEQEQEQDFDILGLVIEQIREEQTDQRILEASFKKLEEEDKRENRDCNTYF